MQHQKINPESLGSVFSPCCRAGIDAALAKADFFFAGAPTIENKIEQKFQNTKAAFAKAAFDTLRSNVTIGQACYGIAGPPRGSAGPKWGAQGGALESAREVLGRVLVFLLCSKLLPREKGRGRALSRAPHFGLALFGRFLMGLV